MSRTTTILPLLAALSAGATASQPEPGQRPRVECTLYTEHTRVEPGQVTWLAVEFEIADGWHIYWPGQNDTGFAPHFDWKLPEGWKLGQPRWPAPHRHLAPGDLLDHVLEHKAVVLFPVKAPPSVVPGSASMFTCHVDWLVCKEMCVAESQDLMYTLRFTDTFHNPLPETRGGDVEVIAGAKSLLPKPLPIEGATLTADVQEGTLVIHTTEAGELVFCPSDDSRAVVDILQSCVSQSGELRISFEPNDDRPIAGVILRKSASGPIESYSYRFPVTSSTELDGFETASDSGHSTKEEIKP